MKFVEKIYSKNEYEKYIYRQWKVAFEKVLLESHFSWYKQ